jgi:AraC-like DNA-binding protein
MTGNNKPAQAYKLTRPAPGDRTVRVGALEGIPAVLRSFGCKPEHILASSGFNTTQFEDPDVRISYVAGSKLLARCVAATGCQHFGLLLGERSVPSHLGIAGYLLHTAPDVGSALRSLVKYLDLHDQGGVATLATTASRTLLGYAIHLPGVEAADQIYDLSIATACNIMRALCGAKWNPTEVLLMRRPPLDLTPYRRFFLAPLRFNADESAVVFQTRWLSHKLPSADPMLQHHLEMEADALHAHQDSDLIGDLHRLLRQCLTSRQCSAKDIARVFGMHERTLNRRLMAEGTSFRHELEQVRYTVSQQLLSGTTAILAEVAISIGYADASAFSRAFKRWSGVTPAQWRAQRAAANESTIR